jgi:presenilin-like A22 family membrane protease
MAGSPVTETPGNIDGAEAGAGWALLEVGFMAVLLTLLLLYRRLPEWAQKLTRLNLAFALALYLGHSAGQEGTGLASMLVFYLSFFSVIIITDEFDVWWILNNLLSVFLAVFAAAYIATLFNVEALLVAFVLFTIYDHVFADRRTWMFMIGRAILKYRLPVIFVVPSTWRFDWDDLVETMGMDKEISIDDTDSEEAKSVSWGIGTADLFLPAGLAATVGVNAAPLMSSASTIVLTGVIAGMLVACARLRYRLQYHQSGAGLPSLAVGVIGGYAIARAVVAIGQVIA